MTAHRLTGAKKGGSGRIAVEEKDSLRSTQFADVIDLVSEGEIEGLVNGLKSVYINKVPLENADGSKNFEGVTFASVSGTQGQPSLPGFDTVQSETQVGVPVTNSTSVVRTITQASTDTVRVTIGVPTLTTQNTTTGDLGGASFEFAIDVQSNGSGYTERYRATVSGKTTTRYQKAIKIELSGPAPWDIRVRRISAASPGSHVQNAFAWDSYTEIQSVKLRYPNSALFALRVSAQQFSAIPTRSYDLMGLRIQVPTNYDPITRVYSGAWNGTFKIAWTNNPAWVFYALATTPRWGLGQFIDPALVDKWGLNTIAQYCDELVSDGRAGTEPRFTCNLVLQTREEAHKVMQDIAAIFRGMAYWAQGSLQFVQDAPRLPTHLFNTANTVDGRFTYAGTSSRTRHSMAIVYWNNPAEHFERVPEVVVDDALVAKLGLREVELSPLGVTSRGQAARIGRWLLYSESAESQTVSFRASFEGAALNLGDVFKVADPAEAGERLGGRIRAATTTAITLDAPVTLAAGESYTASIMLPDASQPMGYLTQERAVTNASGVASTITVTPAFSSAPAAQSIFVLASLAVQATFWRCVSIDEVDPGQYEITGAAHEPGKYAAIEQGLVLEPRPISRLTERPVPPTGLALSESVYTAAAAARSRISAAWLPAQSGQTYRVAWRLNSGQWVNLPDTAGQSIDIDDLQPGLLEVALRAVNLSGISIAVIAQIQVTGRVAMSAPAWVSASTTETGTLVRWAKPTDQAEAVWRDSELSLQSPFAATVAIFKGRTDSHKLDYLAEGTHSFWVTHTDTTANTSAAQLAYLTILLPAAPSPSVVTEGNIARVSWTECRTSQPVESYEIRRGVYSSSATVVGKFKATSAEIIETAGAGTWPYWIRTVDVAGNTSSWVAFNVVTTDRITTSLATLTSGLAASTALITDPTTGLQVKVSDLVTVTNTLTSSVSTLNGTTTTLTNNLATVTSAQAGLISTTSTLSATVSGHGTNIGTLTSSVSTLQTAQAGVSARWGVRLDVNNRITGVILNAGTTQTDAVFLVDKFAIAYASQPDVYPFVVGLVNTVSTVGINGNLMVDGTVNARSMNVGTLSAITANVGTLTAGTIRNAASTNVINLDATGTANVVSLGSGKFTVDANGLVTLDRVNIKRRDVVASGTVSAPRTINYGDSWDLLIDTGITDTTAIDNSIIQPYGAWAKPIITGISYTANMPAPLGTTMNAIDHEVSLSFRRVDFEGVFVGDYNRLYLRVRVAAVYLNNTYVNNLTLSGWDWGIYRL